MILPRSPRPIFGFCQPQAARGFAYLQPPGFRRRDTGEPFHQGVGQLQDYLKSQRDHYCGTGQPGQRSADRAGHPRSTLEHPQLLSELSAQSSIGPQDAAALRWSRPIFTVIGALVAGYIKFHAAEGRWGVSGPETSRAIWWLTPPNEPPITPSRIMNEPSTHRRAMTTFMAYSLSI